MQVIISRAVADFDALASLAAAKTIFPEAAALIPEEMQPPVKNFYNLNKEHLHLEEIINLDNIKTLIIVDASGRRDLGKYALFAERADELIVYDHHPLSEHSLFSGEGKTEPVGSTSTLMVEKIRRNSLQINPVLAQLLALGICQSTGYFTYNTVVARDIIALAWLWEQGVKPEEMQRFLLPPLQDGQVRNLEKALSNTRMFKINGCSVTISVWDSTEFLAAFGVISRRLKMIQDADINISLVKFRDGIYLEALGAKANLPQVFEGIPVQGSADRVTAVLSGVDLDTARMLVLRSLYKDLSPSQIIADEMTNPVHVLKSSYSIETANNHFLYHGHNGFPVVKKGQMVGMLTRKDIDTALRHYPAETLVDEIMTKNVITVNQDDSLYNAWYKMLSFSVGRLPVVDNNMKLVGIITRSDIMRRLYPMKNKIKLDKMTDASQDNLIAMINSRLPGQTAALLLTISREAVQFGVDVYAVGGFVRDLLLGRKIEDIDILVAGDAVGFAARIHTLFGGKIKTNPDVGTAALNSGSWRMDFASSRQEFYLYSGSMPQTEAAAIGRDLGRRDFTINTIACSLNSKDFGVVLDPFNGRGDLEKGLIRVLYNLSFADDPLRILRAVRFSQRLDFRLEPETEGFLNTALKAGSLTHVGKERLGAELRLIFTEDQPDKQIRRLSEVGIWQYFLPALPDEDSFWEWMAAARREWQKSFSPVYDSAVYFLAALCVKIDLRHIDDISRVFYLSRRSQKKLQKILSFHNEIITRLGGNFQLVESAEIAENYPREGWLLIKACGGKIAEKVTILADLLGAKAFLDGNDLLTLGVEQGPEIGKILDALKEARREGKLVSREDELQFVQSFIAGRESN